jgi:hypothetical protein
MSAPAVQERGGIALLAELEQNGAISQIGLHLSDPSLSYERFEAIGFLLGRMHQSLRFAIGDWLMYGERLFPEQWTQAAECLGISEEGMREYLRVSERVPRSTRRKSLSWSHHRAVASLDPPEQKDWLRRAVDEQLSHHALRDALRSGGVSPRAAAYPARCRCCGKEF